MNKFLIAVIAAGSCILGSTAASAAFVTDYDKNGVLLGTWTQSLTPNLVAFGVGYDTDVTISNGTGAALGFTDALWYNVAGQGGLLVGDKATSPINTYGPLSFDGIDNDPTFYLGTYVETDGSIVTISVPEPATWAMMLAGFGLIGLAARRRRNVAVTYA